MKIMMNHGGYAYTSPHLAGGRAAIRTTERIFPKALRAIKQDNNKELKRLVDKLELGTKELSVLLSHACMGRHTYDMAAMLLEAGADPTDSDCLALRYAQSRYDTKLETLLRQYSSKLSMHTIYAVV